MPQYVIEIDRKVIYGYGRPVYVLINKISTAMSQMYLFSALFVSTDILTAHVKFARNVKTQSTMGV